MTLLTVDEAKAQILRRFSPLDSEPVALIQAYDRILAADIRAQADLPPFAASRMDGFAVRAADTLDAPVRLLQVMDIAAGVAPAGRLNPGECARIMTGAVLPDGADAVIPVEDTDQSFDVTSSHAGGAIMVRRAVHPGADVRPAGEDIRAGELALASGISIGAAEMGFLSALGCASVPVFRRPRVAFFSTGDELVEPDQSPAPGQIRDANGYSLTGLIQSVPAEPVRLPTARDTLDAVRRCLQEALESGPDVILSSAGVSVGAHDHVKAAVESMGELGLWRVNIRPGKPLAFGHVGGVPYFGLPGNPVSAMVTFEVFVRPALNVLAGKAPDGPVLTARAGHDMRSDGRRSYIRVTVRRDADGLTAFETGTQSSGALHSMVRADGLLIIPEHVTEVRAGEVLSLVPLRLHG